MLHTDSLIRRTAGRLLLAWLVLAALALTGCTDDLIEALLGDAAPTADTAEQAAAKGLVIAQFDQAAGRVALPNDVVLTALNAKLKTLGKAELTGTTRNMPIRIPFSAAIDYPFADPANVDAAKIAPWASSVFLLDVTAPTAAPIPALPHYVTGGGFKAVYLDANHDLVLVPGGTLLTNEHTYAVVVTRGVKDTGGNAIQASVPMVLVRQTAALTDSAGRSLSSLTTDAEAQALEQLRKGYAPIFDALAAGSPSIGRKDVALLFTFTVEKADSTSADNGSAKLIAGDEQIQAGTDLFAPPNLKWFTSTGAVVDNFDPTADNKALFVGVPLDKVAAIYHGSYTCLNFLNVDANGDFEIDTGAGNAGGIPTAASPADCPNKTSASLLGEIEFWLAKPATTVGIAVFQHGITRSSLDFVAVANTLATIGVATIAIDLWGHGTRVYDVGGAEVPFVRPDDPARTVGYMLQSRLDATRLGAIAKGNAELAAALGGAPGKLYFVGQSLGAIIGAAVARNAAGVSFDAMVLNVPGGDMADIILRGDIAAELIPLVAADQGQAVGSPELNATLLGIELSARHAVFAGLVDPMALYDPVSVQLTPPLLLQQITGDTTIANDDTELLSRMMALPSYADGAGTQTKTRTRWIYDPANYTAVLPGSTAGHGFLLDGLTTATTKGQTQMAGFFQSNGTVTVDPVAP